VVARSGDVMDEVDGAGAAGRRRAVARAVQRRLVAHVAAGGTTDLAPAPLENEAVAYTDPARAELERRALFLALPLVAGLSQDVPAPGDALLFEAAGPSIVVVRGADGVLRGFLNMCTHRGTRLVAAGPDGRCPRRRRLTCPFHAWSFDLDGTLAAVPGRPGFDGVDLGRRHLVAVPVAEWNGLVFVRAAAGAEPLDVAAYLGDFAAELAQLELAGAVPVRASTLAADCDWKIALDTYGEGYHFATLHASTIGTTHYANVAAFDAFGPHWRMCFAEKALAALIGRPESEWPEADYGGVHFLFPNTVMVVGSVEAGRGFLRMYRLFPGATPGTVTCHAAVYVPGGLAPGDPRAEQLAIDEGSSVITQEDYRVAVGAYANLRTAPPGFTVVYGRNEPALQLVHRHVAAAIGARPPSP
jgi:phenylpropionate dioxygenase-like ring-hydroxylating dioxygenase large terminal subunit